MKTRLLLVLAAIAVFQIAGNIAFATNDTVQFPGSVEVKKGETVGDAVAIAGSGKVEGHVTGDAVAILGNIVVKPGAVIDGDAVAILGNVVVEPGAIVNSDAVAIGGIVMKKNGGTVNGTTTTVGGWKGFFCKPWNCGDVGFMFGPLALIVYALIVAALAALVVALFPSKMGLVADVLLEQPGKSVLYGLLWITLAPTIAMMFVMTFFGIPLAALVVLVAIAAWIVGGVCAGLAIGRRLSTAFNRPAISPILAAFIGVLLIELLRLAPVIGWLLAAILYVMAFGAVIMTGFGTNRTWFANLFQRRGTAPTQPPSPPSEPGNSIQPG